MEHHNSSPGSFNSSNFNRNNDNRKLSDILAGSIGHHESFSSGNNNNNFIFTKRRPIILKRGRSSWPVTSVNRTLQQKNVRETCRGSAGAAESLESSRRYTADGDMIYSRRNSFLYRTESIRNKFQNRSNKSSVSYDHSINEAEEVVVTPYAQILLTLKFVKERLQQIFNERSAQETSKIHFDLNEKELPNAIETLNSLDWCLYQLEHMQTHRSVSYLASTKFKRMLSKNLCINDNNKSNNHISQYICQTFTDNSFQPSCEGESGDIANTCPSVLDNSDHTPTDEAEEQWSSCLDIADIQLPLATISPGLKASNWMNQWGTDIFELGNQHPHNILYYTTMTIVQERHLISSLHIDGPALHRFMQIIESKYRPDISYHNSLHASDVLLSANVLLSGTTLSSIFSDFEVFAVLLAAAVHDVDHPGLTNQYLINTNDQLAILYNDNSVLENHHLATTFSVLFNKEYDCNFTVNFSAQQVKSLRQMVIDMVLATDMSKHMTMLADLKTTVETTKVSGSGILNLDQYNDRIQILQNVLHCSDLSNPTKPLELYLQWTNRVMDEFYNQGDKERELQIDISPMCDRNNVSVAQSQVSFIDFVVLPLWEAWADLIQPAANEMLDNLSSNRHYYEQMTQKRLSQT